MAGPVVFISHSWRDHADEARVAALCEAFENLPISVRVDREDLALAAGDEFRTYIHQWMHECRAAVMVLSPEALGSDEVELEAGVLANRKSVAADFVLIPLLVGGTSYDDLKRKEWLKYELSRKQAVQWGDGEAVPAALLERLAAVAALYPGDSPRERFEDDLATDLDNAGLHHRVLERAAEKLKLKDLHRWPERDRTLIFARRLLESGYQAQIEALDVIAYGHLDVAQRILDRSWPYGWIDERAASFIASVAAARRGQRGIAVNTQNMDTARMYVKRVSRDWPLAQVEGGESDLDVEEMLDRARAALGHVLFGNSEVGDADLEKAFQGDALTVFLLLRHPPPRSQQLDGLRGKYPAPTVVVLCGDDTPEQFAGRALSHVSYLDPPVVREHELTVAAACAQALWDWQVRARAHAQ